MFYAKRTSRGLYSVKDKLPEEKSRNVVYAVKCATCSEEYIGETERALGVRKKEYCDAIRLGRTEKSRIAEHVHYTLHEIDWERLGIIDRASRKRERKMRETLHVGKRKPSMNRETRELRGVRFGTR